MEKEEILELMKARHSVRVYEDKKIENDKREVLLKTIEQINKDNDLNIQIFFDEPKCFDSARAHYGKFSGVNNYIALVGKKNSKLDEICGYYGEQLVLLAQSLGLNTCWVALTHGKSQAKIKKGEKQVCLISLGYGKIRGFAHKSKEISNVSKIDGDIPNWFKEGVEAALLAPTAMNQQKFLFELKGEKVFASAGFGFYTKLDLGIAKYHFETITGKKVN